MVAAPAATRQGIGSLAVSADSFRVLGRPSLYGRVFGNERAPGSETRDRGTDRGKRDARPADVWIDERRRSSPDDAEERDGPRARLWRSSKVVGQAYWLGALEPPDRILCEPAGQANHGVTRAAVPMRRAWGAGRSPGSCRGRHRPSTPGFPWQAVETLDASSEPSVEDRFLPLGSSKMPPRIR
jgi:hypothetical protein